MRGSIVVALFIVAGCHRSVQVGSAPANRNAAPVVATATLKTATGDLVGDLTIYGGGSLRVAGDLSHLTPGQHGIHFHAVGKCEAPGFTTAGGHLNPTTKQHGLKNPNGPHAGDFDNITADAGGKAHVELTSMASLDQLLDADGAAIIVHAAMDDQMTDPSGNSGARFACGVLRKM